MTEEAKPEMPKEKPISPAAVYVAIIPTMQETARRSGYAIGVHGSLGRDLDLIAVPWTDEAESAEQLILALLACAGRDGAHLEPRVQHGDGSEYIKPGSRPTKKPHGRLAWSIHFDNGLYIDVSVMPRQP